MKSAYISIHVLMLPSLWEVIIGVFPTRTRIKKQGVDLKLTHFIEYDWDISSLSWREITPMLS